MAALTPSQAKSLLKTTSFSTYNKVESDKPKGVELKKACKQDKPEIKKQLQQENYDRIERYKLLCLLKMEGEAKKKEETKIGEKKEQLNIARKLTMNDIDNAAQMVDRTITIKKLLPGEISETKHLPHNLKETRKFRSGLKKSKRIIRDKAKVKQVCYKQIKKPKWYSEAVLEISSDSPSSNVFSEVNSNNDEDGMEVGQQGSKFYLRGSLYKVEANLRGKLNQNYVTEAEPNFKGCMTREEWFQTLVSKNKKVEFAAQPVLGQVLFPRIEDLQQLHLISSIMQYRKKMLGKLYNRKVRRKLCLKKVKQIKVRKFNLNNYLYGIGSKRKSIESLSNIAYVGASDKTLEHIRKNAKLEGTKRHFKKRRRINYLCITSPTERHTRKKISCTDSVSDDYDWIPDNIREQNTVEHLGLRYRGNMLASGNRGSTLRCHPRQPRDYKGLRIASAIFNETVKISEVPILKKLKDDKYFLENVRQVKETDYGKKFEARRHHDHWDPTQHKHVDINYNRKLIRPKPINPDEEQKIPQIFDETSSRGNGHYDDVNCLLSKLNTAKLIQNSNGNLKAGAIKRLHLQSLPRMQDTIHRSLNGKKLLEFPGCNKFIEFLTKIKITLDRRASILPAEYSPNKTFYLDEIKEDLKSILSFRSSLSSSTCTNLTNESGSLLLAGSKKIPLNYIRKSLLPFEEINRSRFEAVPIVVANEKDDPFHTVPFAGQQMEQIVSAAPKDNFFTFTTRLQNRKRTRLEVKQKDQQKQLRGTRRGFINGPQVVNDIDELFIENLRTRPSLKPFKWNSCHTMTKYALRKKFQSVLIGGEIVHSKIYDRQNEDYFQQMLIMKTLLEKLFSKWEKREYKTAMKVINKVKPYYEATDKYRRKFQELLKQYSLLNMEIVFIENDWTRRNILQSFHYLLADMKWRIEHDWIHRLEDGELEGFERSIAKRNSRNTRHRDKDNAWTIKHFYENVYLKKYHHFNFVFNNTRDLVSGTVNLKSRTMVLLLELHHTLWILAELKKKFEEFGIWCSVELELKKSYVENMCANKYYMQGRSNYVKKLCYLFIGKPIETSFSNNSLNLVKGVCKEVYKNVVPASSQMDISTLEQVAIISEALSELIGKLEGFDSETRHQFENKYRRFHSSRSNFSKQAVLIEQRIVSEMDKVHRNLSYSVQKSKRSELKKIVRACPPKTVKISKRTSFFRRFREDGGLGRGRYDVMSSFQKSFVPFHFDYFLYVNGYQPNYNFKTQIEIRDGPEIERLHFKALLPEVLEKFEKWQTIKKKTIDEYINKNSKMYNNIQI